MVNESQPIVSANRICEKCIARRSGRIDFEVFGLSVEGMFRCGNERCVGGGLCEYIVCVRNGELLRREDCVGEVIYGE